MIPLLLRSFYTSSEPLVPQKALSANSPALHLRSPPDAPAASALTFSRKAPSVEKYSKSFSEAASAPECTAARPEFLPLKDSLAPNPVAVISKRAFHLNTYDGSGELVQHCRALFSRTQSLQCIRIPTTYATWNSVMIGTVCEPRISSLWQSFRKGFPFKLLYFYPSRSFGLWPASTRLNLLP